MEENNETTTTEDKKKERKKAEKEKFLKLKAQREMDAFKRKYFEYYDDVKISHREDW